jgi:hypothetical protein
MQKFFNSFRHYATLTEEQLLTEGRVQDAQKRYPELAKKRDTLDGESVLDVLIQADPSGNQKYLEGAAKILNNSVQNAAENGYEMFWAKKWPDDSTVTQTADGATVTSPVAPQDTDNLISPWGIARNIADLLPRFHKLQPFIAPSLRDINQIETYSHLSQAVNVAEQTQQDKERRKQAKEREKAEAREGSSVIADNDYYTMIRPTTAEASCYYGKGTKWCISSTQSANYFDEYTSEGKSFFFVFFANISNDSKFKKLALVVDSGGDWDEAFDAEDNSLYGHEVVDAIIQNMLYEKQDTGALEAYRYLDNSTWSDPLLDRDKEDFVRVVKELGIPWDDSLATTQSGWEDQGELAAAAIQDKANLWFSEMKDEAQTDARENPAGPDPAEFVALQDAYIEQSTNISVELQFPYDTGASYVTWESQAYVDVEEIMTNNMLVKEKRLKWRINPEQTTDEQDEELKEAVEAALKYIDAWPDEVEADYSNAFEFHVRLDSGGGNLAEFDSFLDNTLYQDRQWDEGFVEGLIEALEEKGLIGRDEKEEEYWPDPAEKEKQIELPFEKGAKEGAQSERDLDYIRSPEGAALRRRVGLRENKVIKLRIRRK